jgi:transcriptional regulator with XRE-family HTH domain
LQARLLTQLGGRLRNGEITIRGLALRAGISQPHLTNILQGRRALTAQTADQILDALDLSLRELLDEAEAEEKRGQFRRPATSR